MEYKSLNNTKDGMKIMTAGFLGVGNPLRIMDALATSMQCLYLFVRIKGSISFNFH